MSDPNQVPENDQTIPLYGTQSCRYMHTGPNNKRPGSRIKRSLAPATGAVTLPVKGVVLISKAALLFRPQLSLRMHACMRVCRAGPWQEPLVISRAPCKRPHTCHTKADGSTEHTAHPIMGLLYVRPYQRAIHTEPPQKHTQPQLKITHALLWHSPLCQHTGLTQWEHQPQPLGMGSTRSVQRAGVTVSWGSDAMRGYRSLPRARCVDTGSV
jgi:hypothetical protein